MRTTPRESNVAKGVGQVAIKGAQAKEVAADLVTGRATDQLTGRSRNCPPDEPPRRSRILSSAPGSAVVAPRHLERPKPWKRVAGIEPA